MHFPSSYVMQKADGTHDYIKIQHKECQKVSYLDSHIYLMDPFTIVLWAPLQHIKRARCLMSIP